MGANLALGANERDVDESLGLKQRLEGAEQVRLVVVPAQAVVLLARDRLIVHRACRCERVCGSGRVVPAGACAVSHRPPPAARSNPFVQIALLEPDVNITRNGKVGNR